MCDKKQSRLALPFYEKFAICLQKNGRAIFAT